MLSAWAGHLGQGRQPAGSPLGVYLHVPFCATRCGYCDFTTYTAEELGREAPISRGTYADAVIAEIEALREALGSRPAATVFLGGGTPTLLDPGRLARILDAAGAAFPRDRDAEVSVEANPDSVDEAALARLREAGFTRVSFGVQSLDATALAVLERTHTPGRALQAIAEARRAGFEHVSADLIYGTPGETDDALRRSLEGVLDAGIDHLSAYSLIVERGTRLAARVRRGEIPAPDDDVMAERYAIVDAAADSAGLTWYEVSNWARPGAECRHNMGYWRGHDWVGFGPGAHSHVRGLRWWNAKNPAAYAERISRSEAPVAGFEVVDDDQQAMEAIMLGLRLREGIAENSVGENRADDVRELIAEGLIERVGTRIAITDRGRLLADAVVRRLA